MPEGDTVWRTAHRLNAALAGEPLTMADLRWPTLATAELSGDTTLEVVSHGKHILQRLSSGLTLHSHLRMEGQWRVERTEDLAPRHLAHPDLRAAVGTQRWTALGMRLGMLDLLPTARERDVIGHLGPDLLGPDWDAETAVANLAQADAPIGAAVLDQTNLAGIGTLWAAEVLFLERVGPWQRTSELDEGRIAAIVARAHTLMDAARHHAMQAPTGIRRKGETTFVHGRSGRPCRRCGTIIRVAQVGPPLRQRTIFYCPACQGGLAPGGHELPRRPLRRVGRSPFG
jgi:endonuclease VIII